MQYSAPYFLRQEDVGLQLTKLPGLALQRICGCLCDVRDLAYLSQSCKRLNDNVQHDSQVWRIKLKQYFGLEVDVENLECQQQGLLYRQLFIKLFQGKEIKYPLRYVGIMTDGGCQEGRLSYWMDHMFFPHTWQYHCSGIFSVANTNIHALGVLAGPAAPTHPLDTWVLEYRDFLQQRFPAFQQYGDLPLHRWEYMFEHLMHMMGDGAGVWEVLLNGLKSPEIEIVRNRISQIVEELRVGKPCSQYGIVDVLGDGQIMVDERRKALLNEQHIQQHTAIIREIFVSREGTVTCPIRTGVVFMATTQGINNQTLANNFNMATLYQKLGNCGMLKNFDNIVNLSKLKEGVKQGLLPGIACANECAAGSWVEFKMSDSVLLREWQMRVGAAVWFQFRDHPEAWSWWEDQVFSMEIEENCSPQQSPFGISVENTQGRCQMNIELKQIWTGNACVVKMIDCENLMEEYNDDNPASNIDINTVRLIGSYVQLPQHVKPKI